MCLVGSRTFGGDNEQDQTVFLDIILDEILDKRDLLRILAFGHGREDARQVDQCEVCEVWTRNREYDNIARERNAAHFPCIQVVVDILVHRCVVRVENGQLGLTDDLFDALRIGQRWTKVDFGLLAGGLCVSGDFDVVMYR